MAENDATEVTEGKLDFDEDNLRGEKKLWMQFLCFRLETCVRLETKKVEGSVLRIAMRITMKLPVEKVLFHISQINSSFLIIRFSIA